MSLLSRTRRQCGLLAVVAGLVSACESTNPTTPTVDEAGPAFHATTNGRPKITYTRASEWTTVGATSILANGNAQITPPVLFQAGALWYRQRVVVTGGFQTEFQFTMAAGCGDPRAADGIAFVVHDDPAGLSAIGQTGGGIGYTGLQNVLAVEVDNWNNGSVDGNAFRSLAVHRSPSRGTISGGPLITQAVPVDFADGRVHSLLIDYANNVLRVSLDGVQRIQLTTSIANLLNANGEAWVGFTGGTGGLCATQVVLNSPNTLPTVNIGGPYTANEGTPIQLSAGASTDANLDPLTYAWDLDNDGAFDDATGATISHAFADNGSHPVRVRVTDHHDGQSIGSTTVTVGNVAPTAALVVPTGAVTEGASFAVSLTNAQDPGTLDVQAGLEYAFDCGSGFGAFGSSASTSCTASDNDVQVVQAKVRDKDGGESSYSGNVTVVNAAPSATFTTPSTATPEGSAFSLALTNATDPGAADRSAGFTYAFDCGTGYTAYGSAAATSCPTIDEGTRTVRAKVRDKDGAETEYTGSAAVANVAPTLGAVTVPVVPIAVGTPVTVTASVADPGIQDVQTATISWDIGAAPEPASVVNGVVTATRSLSPGVYTVTLSVTDGDGGSDEKTAVAYIVVYDPTSGHVTGGGWIDSRAGDCTLTTACMTAAGKSNFGFVSRYVRGATTPVGNTEFDFKAGSFRFRSTDYEWLVTAGARAQYKGRGTVNGGSTVYGFLLTAIDGEQNGGGGVDKFRIKVWNLATGVVVYDNQRGAGDDSDAATAIGGGSIQIHK